MIDVLIVTSNDDPYLSRLLVSIPNDKRFNYIILSIDENPTLATIPGSTYNSILQFCTNPIFTILHAEDYFLQDTLTPFLEFIRYKSWGLVYASSLNPNTKRINPYSELPIVEDTVYSANPMRPPIFYNRKIVAYLQNFDKDSREPEYDMCLKIWERFPVFHYPTPMTVSKRQSLDAEGIEQAVYASKVRHTKQFYYAYPLMYPAGLLDPIIN